MGQKFENQLRCTFTISVTPSLYHNIAAHADRYKLKRTQFIRQLLEAIDDEKLYGKLLGPCE